MVAETESSEPEDDLSARNIARATLKFSLGLVIFMILLILIVGSVFLYFVFGINDSSGV